MNIEKLPRAPMRREDESGYEKEIWQPSWNCFCCHDTGIIVSHLAALVIDGYNSNRDKLPRCVNPGCKPRSDWDSEALTHCVDYRISAVTCQKLDAIERENWRQTVRQKQINIRALAQKMNLRKRDRTPIEETEAQRQHEEVCNANPEKLRAMAQAYLGSEYIKDGTS
jgi:hypothetical protein